MIQPSVSAMSKSSELKECMEARQFAIREFNRVKREKLENERAKSMRLSGVKDDKQMDRERSNRASAAASRAKIVFYSKDLERRTDRLEMERNREMKRADRASKRLRGLQEEVRNLKKALRDIWEMKDQRTCSYLMDSEALFLLSSRQEDSDMSVDDSDSDTGGTLTNGKTPETTVGALDKTQPEESPPLSLLPRSLSRSEPKRSKTQLSSPFKTTSTIRNLVNPISVEPVIRKRQQDICASSMKELQHARCLQFRPMHSNIDQNYPSLHEQRSTMS